MNPDDLRVACTPAVPCYADSPDVAHVSNLKPLKRSLAYLEAQACGRTLLASDIAAAMVGDYEAAFARVALAGAAR